MNVFSAFIRLFRRLYCLAAVFVAVSAFGQGTAAQTIQLLPVADQIYGVAPFQVVALASSNLPVTLTVQGPATINGRLLTVTGAGTVTLAANQAGNADYAPASAEESFYVKPGIPSVQWNPESIVYGTPVDSNVLNATATAIPAADPAEDAAVITYQPNTSNLQAERVHPFPPLHRISATRVHQSFLHPMADSM